MFSDFVVKIPYTTHPNMTRNLGPVFSSNPDNNIIEKKKHELKMWGTDLYGKIDNDTTDMLLKLSCILTDKDETVDIVEFALNFEEDVVVMHRGKIQALCVCFPSGWVPKDKLGWSLTEIHSHVADSEKLTAASQRIAEVMAGVDSFKRYVWSIVNGDLLNQHPKNKPTSLPNSIDNLFFRVETQTTMPIGDGVSSLFFIKTCMKPLTEVFEDQYLKTQLLESLNSMSDAILEYKNLRHIKKLLISNNF